MNIIQWLYAQQQQNPTRPALYVGNELKADYQTFAAAVHTLAMRLKDEYQCQPGDRVVIYAKNCMEYLVAMYAVWWIGGVASPVNYRLHPKEVEWIIQDTGAKLVITLDGDLLPMLEVSSHCQELALMSLDVAVLGQNTTITPPLTVSSDTLAWLFYTSGTTGHPKGVMLTHQNLMSMSLCYPIDVHHVDHNDSIYYAAPISHGAGLYNFIFTRVGARHVFPQSGGFSEIELMENARTLGNLCFFAAPTILKRLTKAAQEHQYHGEGIKNIICGGAPLYVADYLEAEKQLGGVISQIYGQGECPMTITSMRQSDIQSKTVEAKKEYVQTVGSAQSCVEVSVVDANMCNLPLGVSGEIVVRGPVVMKGYWNNPEATQTTIVNGWLKTGDVGFLNEAGNLTLTDRSKDVIISGGSNIYPREVEEVLLHHPDIHEVSVIGVEDPEWGEIVTAHIATNSGEEIDADILKEWCRASIAAFKSPKKYYFYKELPKNSYGKIVKAELRALMKNT